MVLFAVPCGLKFSPVPVFPVFASPGWPTTMSAEPITSPLAQQVQRRRTFAIILEIEKQRGISVASSMMQMEYRDCTINLLDTPDHQDFSEDTYRVLTAVDAALMVIDAANGVERQTRRWRQVCRALSTPILTFVNKIYRRAGRTWSGAPSWRWRALVRGARRSGGQCRSCPPAPACGQRLLLDLTASAPRSLRVGAVLFFQLGLRRGATP